MESSWSSPAPPQTPNEVSQILEYSENESGGAEAGAG